MAEVNAMLFRGFKPGNYGIGESVGFHCVKPLDGDSARGGDAVDSLFGVDFVVVDDCRRPD